MGLCRPFLFYDRRISEMIVKHIDKKLLWDSVVFEAQTREVFQDTIWSAYVMYPLSRVRMRMPKSWCLEVGDRVSFARLCRHSDNALVNATKVFC
jgi:hypothetical protein